MEKLKIKFHPVFIVFIILLLFSNNPLNVVSYILCVFLHELGHYVVAKHFGYKLNKITFLPFGASLSGKENVFYDKKQEILVAIAGPLVNVILLIICLALWWVFPSTYFFTADFYNANLITFIFNLLPVYPLDGGRVLYALLSLKHKREKAYKIIKVIGLVISLLIFVLFIVSAFFKINYTLAMVAIFLFSGLFFEDTSCYYQQNFNFNFKDSKLKTGLETNVLSVSLNSTLFSVLKKLNKYKYNIINVLNNNGEIVECLTETKLNDFFINHNLNDTIKNVLKNKKS